MRCCDCEFREGCPDREPDIVAFSLCGTRMNHLFERERAALEQRIAAPEEGNEK